jgi:hypothetical protein
VLQKKGTGALPVPPDARSYVQHYELLAYAELNNPAVIAVPSSSSFMFIWASLDLI